MEKGRISTRQIAVLIFIFLLGESILIYPVLITSIAKQDAWIASLIGIPCGVLLIWILLKLHDKYPGQNFIQICQTVLGKWVGGLLSIWYLFYFYMSTSLNIRQMGDFLTTQYFNNTPLRIIIILFIIMLIFGVSSGIESIARTAEILLPILILASILLIVSLIKQFEFTQLKPIFEVKPISLLHAVTTVITTPFGQSIMFSMLLPYVNKQPHTNRDLLIAAASSAFLLTIILFISLLVLGPFLSESTVYPTFILAKKISIGDFLQRLEAILTTAWIITAFFKSVINFYATILGTAQFFKLQGYRSLIWVTAMIFFGLSIIVAPNSEYYISTFVNSWTLWDWTNSFILPFLLFIFPVWGLRKKSKLIQ